MKHWLFILCGLFLGLTPISYGQENPEFTCPANHVCLTLLSVNDVYQITPVDQGQRGGLARLQTMLTAIRQREPNALFFLAGDTLSPSPISRLWQGHNMIEAWNTLKVSAATLGNHEFDFGTPVLRNRLIESQFPWFAANVFEKGTQKPFANLPRYHIWTMNGITLGVFGVLTPETLTASKFDGQVTITDPITTSKAVVAELKAKKVDVIVALTHLSFSDDKRLAQACPEIALIMGGHEHSLMEAQAGKTLIFKMGSDARNLGRYQLNVDKTTQRVSQVVWQVIPINSAIAEDTEFSQKMASFFPNKDQLKQPLVTINQPWDARQPEVRNRETNLGSFIADAYRYGVQADVALVNGGSIRSNTVYPSGFVLTEGDLYDMLPFGNRILKLSITGQTLLIALENSVSLKGIEAEPGRFLQVSGITFQYDPQAKPYQRIVNATINQKPVDPKQRYTLAISEFLANGGDDYGMFSTTTGAKLLLDEDDAPLELDLVKAYIHHLGHTQPTTSFRIQEISP